MTLSGHEKPKHTSMIVSRIDPITKLLCDIFDFAHTIPSAEGNDNYLKNRNIHSGFGLLFLLSKVLLKGEEIETAPSV